MHGLKALAPEFQAELGRLCHWWQTNAVDEENGGFYGQIDMDGMPLKSTPKGAIYMARILWFFSMMSLRSGEKSHKKMALRARDFLLEHFIDKEHGGVYWEVDAKGTPTNTRKQGYALAFVIYGLAAHARSCGDEKSLAQAVVLFDTIETHYLDSEQGGYWEAFAQDWSVISDVRLSEKDDNAPKTMNTHLHILEAYTELYRSAPLPRIRAALANLITLHNEKIYRENIGHVRLFWQNDWTDISHDVSFGHDIEASWLMWEAAEVLGDEDILKQTKPIALHIAKTIFSEAIGLSGELYNECRFSDDHIDMTRIWWPQAEALVGFLNAYQLSGEVKFANCVQTSWAFITEHIITDGCEWSWFSGLDVGEVSPYQAGHWKSCYHNGRAMMECLDRLERL